ncbi:hypothetical protein EJ04DRAFT_257497 [Polyplosphaeria fusca]|uniref:Uncharacterized protein n=1 Tax=Polyplosphaeria fusca TaxID=682080 RepID=A0A9P4QZY2_9PLEO|nr:hypothetical protein EJ04DRAFT_257497 [Polyplosphaeria fusca]
MTLPIIQARPQRQRLSLLITKIRQRLIPRLILPSVLIVLFDPVGPRDAADGRVDARAPAERVRADRIAAYSSGFPGAAGVADLRVAVGVFAKVAGRAGLAGVEGEGGGEGDEREEREEAGEHVGGGCGLGVDEMWLLIVL